MAVNFDDQSTGISYQNFPKDPEAREQIAIVKKNVEELKNTTVSRQIVTNLENKFKQNELDNVNYRNQVAETVQTIEEKVDGLDGGNTEKIANLEVAVNNKANKDLVDSLLNQIEGSVKQINGVAPDANGNVLINLETQNLVGKQEFTQKTDQLALQMMDKANVTEVESLSEQIQGSVKKVNGVTPDFNGNVTIDVDTEGLVTKDELDGIAYGLEMQLTEKANQSEINVAKGTFPTLKEKLDNMVMSGGGTGTGSFITPETGDLIELSTTIPPSSPSDIMLINLSKTSLKIKWEAGSFDTMKYKLYVGGVHHSTYDYLNRTSEITNLFPYTDYEIKITSVNESGVESTGNLVTFKTAGYKLIMNGFLGSYLKLPSMLYNKIVIECMVERPAGTVGHLYDGRTEMVQSFAELLATSDGFGFYFNQRFVNGQEVNASKSIWIEDKVRTTLELVKSTGTPVAGVSRIFARFDDRNQIKGELYRIRCYNGVQLIADYNFGKGVYTDQTGNGNELVYTAGNFI